MLLRTLIAWIVLASTAAAQDGAALAKAAQAVLKERCHACHGESGANEGGFNYALNRKRLVRELVVPGDAHESKLFQRVLKGEMPPDGDRLPPAEIETLRQWIAADAPAFGVEIQRPFVSPVDMLTAMLKDLERAPERDRPFFRYFTLTHLHNAGFEDNELESHRQGLSKLVNSLSWGREVRVPVAVDAAKTILRIDLRWYKWNETDAWSHVIAADPYRVTYPHAAAQSCYALTKCELPHVRADWFVFSASRPPLYNIILGLPDQPAELLKFENERLGVNVARNLQDYNDVLRAGFYPSGVSKSIRLIERHVSSYGAYWKSYDFKPVDPKEKTPRRRNLKAHPTGPGGPNDFEHDGGEMIFSLPNGLQGYMLTDAAGQQIPEGPTDVVVDKEAVKRGRDPEVVNGVSCMNCHWSGMLNKTDQVREHVLSQPSAYSKTVVEFVTAVYAPKADTNAKLQEDRERFEAAVKRCGLTGLAKSEPVATLAFQFDEPLDLDLAAAEAGVAVDKFVAALRTNAALGRELGSLPQGQPVPRDTYVQVFGALVQELKVGTLLGGLAAPQLTLVPRPSPGSAKPPALSAPFTTAQAKSAQEAWAKSLGKAVTEKNSLGMELVLIPPGEFLMGSPTTEADRGNDETQHRVKLTKPFWLARTEVTQGQWQQVMGTTPWKDQSYVQEGSDYAATYVSWEDAEAFCAKLSQRDGQTYRLPTEAEWEWSCRAGTTSRFSFGDSDGDLGRYAWFDGNADSIGEDYAHRVGLKLANPFGLSDMHGNVYEWCGDWYDAEFYGKVTGTAVDPFNASPAVYRVLRGGSWFLDAWFTRSAIRNWDTPDYRYILFGLRVARTQ